MSRSARAAYERWWLGKLVAEVQGAPLEPPRRCVRLLFFGPPSFTYGYIHMHFEDGTYVCIRNRSSHRPLKSDVRVMCEQAPDSATYQKIMQAHGKAQGVWLTAEDVAFLAAGYAPVARTCGGDDNE